MLMWSMGRERPFVGFEPGVSGDTEAFGNLTARPGEAPC
jgi:hypothetical protein